MLLRRGEFHAFTAAARRFLYLVPSAAVIRLDDISEAVLETLADGDRSATELADSLASRWSADVVRSSIDELLGMRAIQTVAAPPPKPVAEKPKRRIPLQTLVLNVTSKCNLSCGYCYEYGEDKIVEASTKPRFMNEETAKQSVDFLFSEVGRVADREPDVLRRRDAAQLQDAEVGARLRAGSAREPLGKQVNASLTTNATLLREEIIDWIVENDVGVTVSIDGAREQQDKFRVFSNGDGELRPHRAEHQGAAHAAPAPSGRRARHAHGAEPRRRVDLSPPVRGARLLGSRLRAGDDVVAARVRDRRRGLQTVALRFPDARGGIPRRGARRQAHTASRTCATRSRRFTKE